MSTLKTALESLTDHRGRHGREYALSSLILLVLVGFVCGCNSLAAVWRFGQRLTREQREALGFLWFKMPAHPTLCVAFHGMHVEALELLLSRVMLDKTDGAPLQLTLDGKSLRGSGGVHVLACFCDALKATIGQRKAGRGYDEVTQAIALLKDLPLKGAVVTGDAMFTDRHLCETVVQGGGNYVLPLKDNQPSLKRAALAALEKKSAANTRRNQRRSRKNGNAAH
jgi:hypothetical protein